MSSSFTPAQRRVLNTPGVQYLGRDEKGRPVVGMMSGIPHQWRTWALLKNGDPADITGKVVALELGQG